MFIQLYQGGNKGNTLQAKNSKCFDPFPDNRVGTTEESSGFLPRKNACRHLLLCRHSS